MTLSKVKYIPGILSWAIDIKTFKISYFGLNKVQQQEPLPFDPNHSIVGIFVRR